MTNPIDIIAAALRTTDDVRDEHGMADRARAVVAANALTDERIVEVAAQALCDNGWVLGMDDDARAMARVVLRSVGGA